MWEDKHDLVPMKFGWFPGQPDVNDIRGMFMVHTGGAGYQPICQIVK